MDDEEFRITIRPAPAGATPASYTVETTGAGGTHHGTFALPFSNMELENYILRFGGTRRTVRGINSPDMTLARTFGGDLFKALIADDVKAGYQVAQGIAQGSGRNLRVMLSLTATPELAAIPWEFLYDDPAFLAMSTRTPIVRTLDVDRPATSYAMQLPLRILAVESRPKGVPVLQTGSERKLLTAALKSVVDIGAVTCDWLEDARLGTLNQKLRSGDYHVLHFIGHGGFSEAHKEGALLFEDKEGLPDLVGGDRLATIVGERRSLRLVVLNSCEGARSDISDPFSGVAGRLIERDVPAVIGMQFEITDPAAILFASEFYTVLAEGKPIDTAVSEARLAMVADQNDVEWATPALFMRGSATRLFEISDATAIERVTPLLPVAPETDGAIDGGTGAGDGPPPIDTPTPIDDVEPKPASIGERIRAYLAAHPLLVPLVLAIVGVIVVAGVAWALLQGSKASLLAKTFEGQPDVMTISGAGFQSGETVDLQVGDLSLRIPVDVGGQFTTQVTRPAAIQPGELVLITATGLVSKQEASTQARYGGSGPIVTPSAGGTSPPPSAAVAGYTCRPPGTANPSILFFSDRDEADRPRAGDRLYCIDPGSGAMAAVPMVDALPATTDISASTWAPKGMDIALTSGSRPNRDIYILAADGRLEPLATGGNDDSFPAWSIADDIAFVKDERGTANEIETRNSRLMLKRRGEPNAVTLLAGLFLRAPAWSPDGTQLAFFGQQVGRDDYDIGVLTFPNAPVVPASIADARQTLRWLGEEGINELNPSWSPDGTQLAFVGDQGSDGASDNEIFVANADLSNARQRTGLRDDMGGGVQDGNPVWSPDGTQIVFYRAIDANGSGYHLWLMSPDGSGQRDLMETRGGRNLDPSWR